MSDDKVQMVLNAEAILQLESQTAACGFDYQAARALIANLASGVLSGEVKSETMGPLMILIMIGTEAKAIDKKQADDLTSKLTAIGQAAFSKDGIEALYQLSNLGVENMQMTSGEDLCVPALRLPYGQAIDSPYVLDFLELFNQVFGWPHAVVFGTRTMLVMPGLTRLQIRELFAD